MCIYMIDSQCITKLQQCARVRVCACVRVTYWLSGVFRMAGVFSSNTLPALYSGLN